MNKRTRIGLIVLVTVVLLLALTIPSLAKKSDEPTCFIRLVTENKNGDFYHKFKLYGDLYAAWEDGKRVNNCTGTISFGDQINKGNTIASFEKWCDYYSSATCIGGVFSWTSTTLGLAIYDPITGDILTADFCTLVINEGDGYFEFSKEYTPTP